MSKDPGFSIRDIEFNFEIFNEKLKLLMKNKAFSIDSKIWNSNLTLNRLVIDKNDVHAQVKEQR